MTVGELIRELSKYPKDQDVAIAPALCHFYDVEEIEEVIEMDGKVTLRYLDSE